LVAIFWADVDTTEGGTVWYRESTNQTILNRATEEVRTYFFQFIRFQAKWVFIATWDNVAFFGCSDCTKVSIFVFLLSSIYACVNVCTCFCVYYWCVNIYM
jgi:hypothetical protein